MYIFVQYFKGRAVSQISSCWVHVFLMELQVKAWIWLAKKFFWFYIYFLFISYLAKEYAQPSIQTAMQWSVLLQNWTCTQAYMHTNWLWDKFSENIHTWIIKSVITKANMNWPFQPHLSVYVSLHIKSPHQNCHLHLHPNDFLFQFDLPLLVMYQYLPLLLHCLPCHHFSLQPQHHHL